LDTLKLEIHSRRKSVKQVREKFVATALPIAMFRFGLWALLNRD